MIYYQPIRFESHDETFKYRLIKKKIFATGYNFGNWELRTPENKVVAKCMGSIIVAYPNYMWDGSTVVGKYYEDEITLEASLLHDILYNANKNPDNIEVPFTLFQADKIFKERLLGLYKNERNFFKAKIFPNLYYLSLITIGIPWKFGTNDYYKLFITK
ncbi:MAG: hypothetical protein IJ341_12720 [Bacteroidales bacterium]|nr:hypothetical protein [Bacteroidales bacterium]